MGWIQLDILGEAEPEERPKTPKEPDITTNPQTRKDTRLLKQVININGDVVTIG
jgi:hypothetical protein